MHIRSAVDQKGQEVVVKKTKMSPTIDLDTDEVEDNDLLTQYQTGTNNMFILRVLLYCTCTQIVYMYVYMYIVVNCTCVLCFIVQVVMYMHI